MNLTYSVSVRDKSNEFSFESFQPNFSETWIQRQRLQKLIKVTYKSREREPNGMILKRTRALGKIP